MMLNRRQSARQNVEENKLQVDLKKSIDHLETDLYDDSTQTSQATGSDTEDGCLIDEDIKQDDVLRRLPDRKLVHFIWTTSPQPHAIRRRMILAKFPEIEELCGNDPYQAVPAILTICIQLYIAVMISQSKISWYMYLIAVTVVSATLNHSLFAAMHESSHNTIFKSKLASELFCILTTIPMGIPAAIPFKRYHLDHHVYQGVSHLDPDIPTEIEAKLFNSTILKFIWVLFMPATYSLRPMITRPKKVVPLDMISWILILSTDFALYYFYGLKCLLYLLLGTFFSMNFHPFAGHFISEHFVMPKTDMYQETSSYYGWGNFFTYNVGYHNEHHDFPRVPGSRLPLITKIAPEFYSMPNHPSWMMVTWNFILGKYMSPFNRVKRISVKGGPLPQDLQIHKYHEKLIPSGGKDRFWPTIS